MKNVLELLENSAYTYPDKTAIKDECEAITFSEYKNMAKTIGTHIAKFGVTNRPVIVFIDQNHKSPVMFMSVLYSGNFYVPVDSTLPLMRIQSIIETLQPIAVLASKDMISVTNQMQEQNVVYYEDALSCTIDEEKLQAIRDNMLDTDPCCCIFTSGSTGRPKGVLKSHRSVLSMANIFTETFGFTNEDVFGNQSPYDFDVSLKNIYNTMKTGATLVVIPRSLFSAPARLIDYLNDNKITVAIWAVSAICIMANLKAMKNTKPLYLKKVLFSGEILPIKNLEYWQTNLPDAMYVNLFGPTEMTGNCTYYKIERTFDKSERVPIGRALPNTKVILLNEDNTLASKGSIGEICISGACLASCYYNEKNKTDEVFVQNPLNNMYPEIIYRTGDLAYENEDGDLVFVSRKDYQIKHMGHRIELPEIEIAVNSIDYIQYSCCVFDSEKNKIVLFYQAEKECTNDIIQEISKSLPKWMQPNRYVWLEKMPMNDHGKIDRAKIGTEYLNK